MPFSLTSGFATSLRRGPVWAAAPVRPPPKAVRPCLHLRT